MAVPDFQSSMRPMLTAKRTPKAWMVLGKVSASEIAARFVWNSAVSGFRNTANRLRRRGQPSSRKIFADESFSFSTSTTLRAIELLCLVYDYDSAESHDGNELVNRIRYGDYS